MSIETATRGADTHYSAYHPARIPDRNKGSQVLSFAFAIIIRLTRE